MLASQQVLERLTAIVAAGAASLAGRFWCDRFHPVDAFPAGKAHIVDEDLQADDDGDDITWPRVQLHRLTLELKLDINATERLDREISAVVLDVLKALEGSQASATLQPLKGCALRSTGWRSVPVSEGQAANAQAVLRVEVLYRTHSNDPETLI